MNIRDLRYFRALAQTGHVGKAAVQCHVSQPTLSMQIKKMEQELGVLLFERSRQAWRLSPAGMHALALAKESLTLIDALKSDMQAFKNPLAGQVALGLFPTLAPFWLPSLLPGLRRALPDIHWSMQEHVTEDCLSALHEGALDVIVIEHQPDPSTGIVAQKLFSED